MFEVWGIEGKLKWFFILILDDLENVRGLDYRKFRIEVRFIVLRFGLN